MKSNKMIIRIAMALLVPGLAGCGYLFGEQGYFPDRSTEYREAKVDSTIVVPQHLDDEALVDLYVIPPVTESILIGGEFKVPRPAPLVAGAVDDLVRIQKLGEEHWVLVAVAPGQLWPQVRSFLTVRGYAVGRLDARAGLIETAWLQPKEGMAERYQFRIEQGVQRTTSELHVLQMYQAGDVQAWPETSSSAEFETEMLQDIAQFVANMSDASAVSMVAQQAINASGKISIQEDQSGNPYISLDLPFHRAWASTARALEDSSFEINDRDRSQGNYYVTFIDRELAEDEGGWMDWLWSSDEDNSPLDGKSYLLRIKRAMADTVHISLENQDGSYPAANEAQTLLAIIKGHIA